MSEPIAASLRDAYNELTQRLDDAPPGGERDTIKREIVSLFKTVDQGIEVLTGIPAGVADEEGRYPEKSINGMVQANLSEFAERRAAFGKGTGDEEDE